MQSTKTKSFVFNKDLHGFLKQENPEPFNYDKKYKAKQSTNDNMSWLRIGWLMAGLGFDKLKDFKVVDIGSGNGNFVKVGQKIFKQCVPYDLAGESISEAELYSTNWDLIVMSDVLEHYKNIDDLWNLNFNHALISYPEYHNSIELERWRHYKPNEHIYCLNLQQFLYWVKKNDYNIIQQGCPEDAIRTRYHKDLRNITTVLIGR